MSGGIVTIATVHNEIQSLTDLNDPFTNRFGGKPSFLISPTEKQLKEKIGSFLNCSFCNGLELSLVTQIYAPLDSLPTHHRFLHIFCCPNCSNSFHGYIEKEILFFMNKQIILKFKKKNFQKLFYFHVSLLFFFF